MRVHELAKSLKIDNREVVRVAKELGLNVANSMTSLEENEVNTIRNYFNKNTTKKNPPKDVAKPRVNVDEIEKRLAQQAKEKEQKEIEEKKKSEEAKRQREQANRNRKKREATKPREERAGEVKRTSEKSDSKDKGQRSDRAARPDRRDSTTQKDRFVQKNSSPKDGNKPPAKQFKKDAPQKETAAPTADRGNKPYNKKRTTQKSNKREDKTFNERDNKPSTFRRDLTKKTGLAASKQKAAQRKDDKVQDGSNVYSIKYPITVKEFGEAINRTTAEIITKLMGLGVMATINQNLDEEVVEVLAIELGVEIEAPEPEVEVPISEQFGLDSDDKEEDLEKRAPVVTVMGHVDHGKTSLLDKIKSTKVTAGEAGGITQHIGAYTVRVEDEKITFLDTPGHEAFTMMRMRGTQVTDIAILVVAADDGVMPQTIEAIAHARSAEVPIIVAINKMDKPEANPERVKQELAEQNLIPEDWGGDTIVVPVSAHTGEGINELLDMVLLVAEVQELKANPNRLAVASVIEAKLDVGKGPVATVLVQKGTLKVGDNVASGVSSGRIRNMLNDKGKPVKKAGPSIPVEIHGLSEVPNAGDLLYAFADEKEARTYADAINQKVRSEQLQTTKVSLDDLFSRIREGELKELNLIVKGDVKGSVEALVQSILKIPTDEVKINIVHTGVGGIVESDISLASASNAIIIGFNVRPNNNSLDIAKEEKIDIRTYTVIYKALEDIEAAIKGMHAPKFVENFIGRAEVRDTFKLPNGTIIAGSYMISGKITRESKV
ncbi:MAG: translation initiation factor IF-2, partial [Neofamilia sp.]